MKSFGFEDLFGENMRRWVKDPNGNSTGGWGLKLTPRDRLRLIKECIILAVLD
ncbi:hypothetical protein WX45_03512 [Clostridium ljungdahlii DSM 13528]|nr:hypothetical protein [Clostridium autoethanogenum]ALU37275.1 Hypothetical protein CLAU_2848 [Clostridium autoethanogenum DSM 10061]OAA87392.1 hypothetical protein WX45_03512 [Clostridium ljungdahlii DSM 13528]OAA92459.1 hypothetical protein WX73_00938 [Clostridium coskatii]OBR89942.1 hypothetical protein CLCOS_42510 [Clostridium coskatii]OVY50157.1 hypothetical protein WX72_02917 [Clostridium autoethanogenum]